MQGNPWLDTTAAADVRERPFVSGERDRREWLPASPKPNEERAAIEPLVPVEPPTGPTAPQPHVPMPEDGLAVRRVTASAALWIVGAHGGAGESTLAELDHSWRASGHSWPEHAGPGAAVCALVARTNVRGLLAAQTALTQWAASGAGESAQLVGLILVADAPGKLPGPIRDLATMVGGGAPRVWHLPWVEAWRLGDPVTERVPRPVSKTVRALRALAATASAVADPSQH